MKIANYVQTAIHVLEAGAGHLIVRWIAIIFAGLSVVGYYDLHCYHNFSLPEAMEQAQLAKNFATGQGYTTLCLRPFDVYLVRKHNQWVHRDRPAAADEDFGLVRKPHPDIVNPPVFPLLEAGVFSLLPPNVWTVTQGRYVPEFAIAVLNQLILLLTVWVTFLVGRQLFDQTVGWLSALLVFGCDPLWQYSVSGLSTNLQVLILLGIVACLLSVEENSRLYYPPLGDMFVKALAAGLLAGLGFLTRYSLGWVIVPVVIYLALFGGDRRRGLALVSVGGFLLLAGPWVARNYVVSGVPFGLAGFRPAEGTLSFPGSTLEQLLHPVIANVFSPPAYMDKLLNNFQDLFLDKLAHLAGSWTAMLFLTGLLMSFRGYSARRMRYFVLFCILIFIVVEAVGRTPADEAASLNPGNLLVLLTPLIAMYATVFFLQFAGGTHTRGGFLVNFLDKQTVPLGQLRILMGGVFVAICSLPLIYALTGSQVRSSAYPPYYPPDLKRLATWMKPDELVMSDIPWAIAWYGRREAIWTTANCTDQFYSFNDFERPINALYLSPVTLDSKFFTGMYTTTENTWTQFALSLVSRHALPANFPLSHLPPGEMIASGIFLADHDRWSTAAP